MEKEQSIAEKMAAETTAMAEDAQRDLGLYLQVVQKNTCQTDSGNSYI